MALAGFAQCVPMEVTNEMALLYQGLIYWLCIKLNNWFMEATDIRAVLRMRSVEVLKWAEMAWPDIIYI